MGLCQFEGEKMIRLVLMLSLFMVPATSFKDQINLISKESKINIVVDWKALEEIGVEKDTPVSINVSNVTYGQLLELILWQTSPDLSYYIDGNIITITTKAKMAKMKIVKVYDLSDLLHIIQNFRGPTIDITQAGQNGNQEGGIGGGRFLNGGGGGGSAGGSLFTDGEEELIDGQDSQIIKIIQLIQDTVNPEEWNESGSISSVGSQIVVSGTSSTHKQLADL